MTTRESQSAERVAIEVEGTTYEVVSLQGEEGLSRLFRFEVICRTTYEEALSAEELLAKEATISLRDGFGVERQIRGIVAEATGRVYEIEEAEMILVIRPRVYPLSLMRDSYVLHDVDVIDVCKDVLYEHTGPVRYDITGSYAKRFYCAQYREDDWTFLSRLLEVEGIYYWFDHRNGDTTLVFSDDSTIAPELVGGPLITFAPESGMDSSEELIKEIASETQATSTKFTVASFDPWKPSFKVSATTGQGPLEIYHSRGGNPESPDVCAARARVMQEGAKAAGLGIAGRSTSIRLSPGMIFELADHPLSRLEGRYLVTEATYRIVQRRRGTKDDSKEFPYECRFRGIPEATVYRPPQDSPLAKQAGLQSAVVAGAPGEEVHPDERGRVRVQLYWDRIGIRDERSGKWMRIAQRGTASSMLLPRIGWTVLVFNEEGDIDAPSVLSRIYDGEHLPPYSLPDNKTRVVFKTATTPGGGSFNEIYYEDTQGAEEMFINASKDMNVFVQNLKNDYIHHDHTRSIGQNHDLSIVDTSIETVTGNQTVAIGSNEKVSVGDVSSSAVSGDETVSIGGKRTLKTGQGCENTVTGDRTLNVGAALIDTTLGNISATAIGNHKMLVGGAVVKVSGGTITEEVGKASLQVIGGVKLESAKTNWIQDVRQVYLETVGGAMLLDSSKRYLDHADTWSKWKVGATHTQKAPDIWIEATDKIELKCGASVLVVKPDTIELRSPKFDLSGASHLEAITATIEHN